jgi:hypothetical protein
MFLKASALVLHQSSIYCCLLWPWHCWSVEFHVNCQFVIRMCTRYSWQGYSNSLQEIRHLCSYLQDLKKASAEEMRRSVYANYASFIRSGSNLLCKVSLNILCCCHFCLRYRHCNHDDTWTLPFHHALSCYLFIIFTFIRSLFVSLITVLKYHCAECCMQEELLIFLSNSLL